MKKIFLPVAALAFFFFGSFDRVCEQWSIVPGAEKINFEFVSENTKGSFSGLEGTVKFDIANPSAAAFDVSVPVKKLHTDNQGRTQSLLSARFFNAELFPQIQFSVADVTRTGAGFVAAGTLTIKGISKPVSLPFTFERDGRKGVFKGNLEIYLGDFDVMPQRQRELELVKITLEVPVEQK